MGRMTSTSGCSESVAVVGGAAVNNQEVMFPPGAVVQCTSFTGEDYQGEILAFDLSTKMLALLVGTKPNIKLTLVNLAFVNTEIRIVKEAPPAGSSFVPRGNCEKAKLRFEEAVERKRISLPKVDVSKEGHLLFRSISRTHSKIREIHWEEDRIVFQNVVVVKPPYRTENVELIPESSTNEHHRTCALDQVSKQVEKFWRSLYKCNGGPASPQVDTTTTDDISSTAAASSKSHSSADRPTSTSADIQAE